MLQHVLATRYVAPLREGGSLPGLMEADDLGTYVVKFRGAGQGAKALVAEVIVGELARRLGIRVPELKVVTVEPAIARYEADEEVQDLLNASIGPNLGVDFLPGSLGYDGASLPVPPEEAASIVWLDGYVANVDRSWQNPNLLGWHKQIWCIDHGAALYFHHSWKDEDRRNEDSRNEDSRNEDSRNGDKPDDVGPARFARQPYSFDKHILWANARAGSAAPSDPLADADARLAPLVTENLLNEIVAQVPDEWLAAGDPDGIRGRYVDYLLDRARTPRAWLLGAVT